MENSGAKLQSSLIELDIIIPNWHRVEIGLCVEIFKSAVNRSVSTLLKSELLIKTHILELTENDTNIAERNHVCNLLITHQITRLPCCICVTSRSTFGLNELNTNGITTNLYYMEAEQYQSLLSKTKSHKNNDVISNSISDNATIADSDSAHIKIDELVSIAIKKYDEFNLLDATTMYVLEYITYYFIQI